MTVQTWIITMGPEECARFLDEAAVGRLGVVLDGRPEIFPVNHVYDRQTGAIAFPTNDSTKMQRALNWPFVAYEVDGEEPDHNGAWSVAVVGTAEEVTDPALIDRWSRQRHVTWRPGDASKWIRIVPSKVTGRHIFGADPGGVP